MLNPIDSGLRNSSLLHGGLFTILLSTASDAMIYLLGLPCHHPGTCSISPKKKHSLSKRAGVVECCVCKDVKYTNIQINSHRCKKKEGSWLVGWLVSSSRVLYTASPFEP